MKVTATDRGYYGNGIKDPGDTFELADKKHFSDTWMVKGTEAPAKDAHKHIGYHAARSAAGKFVVKDAAGQMVGTFTGTKEDAENEAERLNQGGDITPAKDAQDDLPDA